MNVRLWHQAYGFDIRLGCSSILIPYILHSGPLDIRTIRSWNRPAEQERLWDNTHELSPSSCWRRIYWRNGTSVTFGMIIVGYCWKYPAIYLLRNWFWKFCTKLSNEISCYSVSSSLKQNNTVLYVNNVTNKESVISRRRSSFAKILRSQQWDPTRSLRIQPARTPSSQEYSHCKNKPKMHQ